MLISFWCQHHFVFIPKVNIIISPSKILFFGLTNSKLHYAVNQYYKIFYPLVGFSIFSRNWAGFMPVCLRKASINTEFELKPA